MTEHDDITRVRQGCSQDLIDKLKTIASLPELQGFIDGLRMTGQDRTPEEWQMVARFKAEMQRGAR